MQDQQSDVVDWSIPGAADEPIFGTSYLPSSEGGVRGSVLLCHGFMGYKDYGFFPYLARRLASAGFVAHGFNFSHSGVTPSHTKFKRVDLFERDTWNKQVHDLTLVHDALRESWLPGPRMARTLPVVWFGHSRGGVTALLAAARRPNHAASGDDNDLTVPAGLCIAAAPASACRLSPEDKARLREQGYMEYVSSRTQQTLRIGRGWLDEIEADPARHDPLAAMATLRQPVAIIHGQADQTVLVADAHALAAAAGHRAKLHLIPDASHTFNCPNPLEGDPPAATEQLGRLLVDFAVACTINALSIAP